MSKITTIRLGLGCNHNCLFCTIADDNDQTLSTKEAIREIYSASKKGTDIIVFTGGEPTIRDDLPRLFRYAKKQGIETIELQTNGIKLSDKDYFKDLLDSGLDHVFISIHSHKKEIYNKITSSDDYEKSIQALKNITDSDISIYISHVINKLNYKDMIDFCKFIHGYKKEIPIYLGFLRPNGNSRINKDIIPRLTDIEPYILPTLTYLKENNSCFEIEGLPLCYMKGFENNSSETIRSRKLKKAYEKPQAYAAKGTEKHDDFQKQAYGNLKKKSSRCKNCKLDDICFGVWKEYAELFGTKELKPIPKENRNSDIVIGTACNSSCIMCTTLRTKEMEVKHCLLSKKEIIRQIDELDNPNHISITGGEPTLRNDLPEIIRYIKKKHPKTELSLLTNGRRFYYNDYTKDIIESGVNKFIIPLHAHRSELHDFITRSKGSFRQTCIGIKNLFKSGANAEIRIVVHGMNYPFLPETASLIRKHFRKAHTVFLYFDAIGSANINRDKLLVNMEKVMPYLEKALDIIDDVRLYHFPLCLLNEKNREKAKGKTVVERRIGYAKACHECKLKDECPGIWKTYLHRIGEHEFKAIRKN
ncbi:MAG: radical SAM protein [Candidatus Woesearchaeota archaeon]